MSTLFGRRIILQLGTRVGIDTAESFEGLNISFRVKKTLKASPNTATIEVFNIGRTSLEQIIAADRSLRVRLLAGHRVPSLIFEGFPILQGGIEVTKEGPNRILKIQAQDGAKQFERARVNLSLGQSTTIEDVLVEVAGSLGLPVGAIDLPADATLTQGRMIEGSASDVLDSIAMASNADWSIQDGKFQFIGRRSSKRGRGALLSDRLNNIIGEPGPRDGGVEVVTPIHASFVPGALFRLDRQDETLFNGDYKIHEVEYTGGLFQNDFEARVWGMPYETQEEGIARMGREQLQRVQAIVDQVQTGLLRRGQF